MRLDNFLYGIHLRRYIVVWIYPKDLCVKRTLKKEFVTTKFLLKQIQTNV